MKLIEQLFGNGDVLHRGENLGSVNYKLSFIKKFIMLEMKK
ncbi:hypothetical protein BH20ACI4_BH20ACI4_13250 [soil metagenome]